MSIVKMSKLSLVGLESDKKQIIDSLMEMGVVHIVNIQQEMPREEWEHLAAPDGQDEAVAALEADMARVKSAIDYLSQYDTRKKGLFEPKRDIHKKEYEDVLRDREKLWDTVTKIGDYDEQLAFIRSEINKYTDLVASLEPWKALTIPVEIDSTRDTLIIPGTIPSTVDMANFEQELSEGVPPSFFQLLNQDRDQYYTLVMIHKSYEEEAMRLLKQVNFKKANFKGIEGTVQENISRLANQLDNFEPKREKINEEIKALAAEKESLEIFFDNLTVQRDRKKILSRMVRTENVFLLEGWLPSSDEDKVKKQLIENWDLVVEISQAGKDEEHPILLDNPAIVKPFELITEMYSLPSSKGIDPNIFMAPFYFMFFGLMVGDAGYGILMAAITGFILIKYRLEGFVDKIVKLLFLGGISTFIWGALFGGWFGDIADMLLGKKAAIPPIWFNPLEDPMKLLIWSFIFGAIQLYVGMGLMGYRLIKDGKPLDALFDIGFWYVFLTGLILLLAGGMAATIGKYMAIVGAVLLILTQGRNEKNIFKKLFSGVLSLYNAVGFMSDVMSYSRLLALGMATGVIASVINTLGVMLGFNIPGIIVLIIVFTVGHIFNMVINALGAYVHSSRLQYVEFFGKFYEGGGKPYQPFKINTKYINLNDRRKY